MASVVVGTWGSPAAGPYMPLCHPRSTLIVIERHLQMFRQLYAPTHLELLYFGPYFVALDRVPTYSAVEEVARYQLELSAFAAELRESGVRVTYGHCSHYCHPLSLTPGTSERSIHELHYLAALARTLGLHAVAIHLVGKAQPEAHDAACRVLDTFTEEELRVFAIENTSSSTALELVFTLMERFPVNIALDTGHLWEAARQPSLSELKDVIQRIATLRPGQPHFIHLAQEIKGRHQPLELDWMISVTQEMREATSHDLHLGVESPTRIRDACALRAALLAEREFHR